ncbi:MAG: glycosyltransferase family 39 protein, partial [Spirulinaceae cyanobacterium]
MYKLLAKYKNKFLYTSCVFIIIGFVALVVLNTFNNTLIDHTEGHLPTVAWLLQTDNYPLYHSIDSAKRYSLIYGPVLYLTQALFLHILSPSILAAKVPISLALILSIFFLFLLVYKLIDLQTSVVTTTYIILVIICFGNLYGNILFQIRSDSLILMLTCLLTLITAVKPGKSTIVAAIITIGLCLNLKFTSIIYFLPLLYLIYNQQGISSVLVSLGGASLLSLLPFIHSQISLLNYLAWIKIISNHGLDFKQLEKNVVWALYLLFPFILLIFQLYCLNISEFKKTIVKYRDYLLLLLVSILLISFIAAKPGSGIHHLLPFIPSILYVYIHFLKKTLFIYSNHKKKKSTSFKVNILHLMLAVIFTLTFYHGGIKGVLLWEKFNTSGSAIIADIEKVIDRYPNTNIEMGYGENKGYPFTYYRPILVFHGNPYLIDANVLMDMRKAGIDISNKTIEVLDSCSTQIWL